MKDGIDVTTLLPLPHAQFRVIVTMNTTTTEHLVDLQQEYFDTLDCKKMSPEVLIEKSFEFLLEREPNTSILQKFNLEVISQYFPEYEKTICSQGADLPTRL